MTDRVGQRFGNYQLVKWLGQGGYAEVYLGKHVYLNTQAAIKVLLKPLFESHQESFLKEARTVASLVHPNIVRVLEYGVVENTPFLAMSYAPGGSLRHRHSTGTLPSLETIVSYVKQIAGALQYAHDRRLVHRDVKPENMLLGRNDEVLLSDFGLALVAQSSSSLHPPQVAGTLAYMAPEQLRGRPRQASDQYALGIVVYEWLSGNRPFTGTNFFGVANKHLSLPPPPLREKRPDLSLAVEEVVMRALAKDPHQRFGSVQAFAHALEKAALSAFTVPTPALDGTSSPLDHALTHKLPSVARKRFSRRAITLGIAGLGGLLLTSGGLLSRPVLSHHTHPDISNKTAALSPTLAQTPPPAGTLLYTYRGYSSENVRSLVWSPDGQRIGSVGDSVRGDVRLWDAFTGDHVVTYQSNNLGWSPDGKRIASNIIDGSLPPAVAIWDPITEHTLATYPNRGFGAWSPDSKYIASNTANSGVLVWDSATGEPLYTLGSGWGFVTSQCWSPQGHYIALSTTQAIQVWDVTAQDLIFTYQGSANRTVLAYLSPDGKRIVSAALLDTTLQVWDAMTGGHVVLYNGHTNGVRDIAWSPDGKRIASAGNDATVQVWDAATGATIFTYRGHLAEVGAVTWSPDGKFIASGGAGPLVSFGEGTPMALDSTVQVWQAPL